MDSAWTAFRATYTQRAVDLSRQRKVAKRKAANAADTSIQAARATRKKGYWYESLSNTPASQRDRTTASHITEILSVNKTHYTVRWSEPAGAPAESKERLTSWTRKQNTLTLNAFRAKQQAQQAQDDTQTDTDSSEQNGE